MASDIRRLIESPPVDASERRELAEAARQLHMSLETPRDALLRMLLSGQQLPMLRIAIELGIFELLARDPAKRWSISTLAEQTSSEPLLMMRILRYFVVCGMLNENPPGSYTVNELTLLLAESDTKASLKLHTETILPAIQILPDLLKREGWRNPVNPKRTAFNAAHRTELPFFQWRPPDSGLLAASSAYTKGGNERRPLWDVVLPLDAFELSREDLANDRTMFVDVGASDARQCIALRKIIGSEAGKVICQPHPASFSSIDDEELSEYGVERSPHNFFDEQPVHGARAYFLDKVLHCWPDEFCKRILGQLSQVLEVDSMILVNDIVLPNRERTWQQTMRDFEMMATHAGMERSKQQWVDLLSSVGLRIDDILTYDKVTGDSLLVVKTIGLCTVS